jgi:trigger factor
MKALVEEVNTVQRRIRVEVPSGDVKTAFDTVYRNLQKKARINGFRPGKAPLTVIRKLYGQSVAYDVVEQLVSRHLSSAIEKESIRPIATPVLETVDLPKEDADYTFSVLVDVMPPLDIQGYKGLELSCKVMTVGDAEVEREIEFVQRRHAKTKEAAEGTPAAPGQIVKISQKATIDNEVFDEFTFDDVPVELGKKYLLPELEEGLVGMKVGEEKTLEITIPDHIQDKSKIGMKAQAAVRVEGIMEMTLPEVNDELAKDMGLENLDALKKSIRERLDRQADSYRRNQLETAIFQQLSEKHQFEVPPSMVDQVIDSIFDEMEFESDKDRKAAKANREQRARLLQTAKDRAKNTLILSEVIKQEKVEVNDDDFDAYVRDLITGSNLSQNLDAKLVDSIKASMGPHARESLLFKKALDFVINHAKVTETKEESPK